MIKMNKNKISLKQNDGGEKKRWTHFYDNIVVGDFAAQFRALVDKDEHDKDEQWNGVYSSVTLWSKYLNQDFLKWKEWGER
jgi:hypothetical protein